MKTKSLIQWMACAGTALLLSSGVAACSSVDSLVYPGTGSDSVEATDAMAKKYRKYAKEVSVDGVTLRGWMIERPGKPLLIFYGGNAMNLATVLPTAERDKQHATLLMNYRGYGGSEGKPSEKALVQDAVYLLDKVCRETKRKPGDVVLVGQSLGSGVAVQVAAQRPVGKLVLLVPFDSIEAVARGMAPGFMVDWALNDTYRSDKFAPKVKCPVTIIAATHDSVVPIAHARKLAASFGRSVKWVEFPCGHNGLWKQKGFLPVYGKACALPK